MPKIITYKDSSYPWKVEVSKAARLVIAAEMRQGHTPESSKFRRQEAGECVTIFCHHYVTAHKHSIHFKNSLTMSA